MSDSLNEMTPEEMREKILDLMVPVREFCREYKIASFSFDDGPREGAHERKETMGFSFMRKPLPPAIKCVLKDYGCIYVER